jgi:coenzyme F420-reducing hydrogenase gamma subunit
VDFELRGCPVSKHQLLEVIAAFLAGRRPAVPDCAVCVQCKRAGIVCVMVARGVPCLGPVTHAGCGALCPGYDRGCYGCYGPAKGANVGALVRWFAGLGVHDDAITRLLHTFNANAPEFRPGAAARQEGIRVGVLRREGT